MARPTLPQLTAAAVVCLLAAGPAMAQEVGPNQQARRADSVTPTTSSVHDPADAILDRLLGGQPAAEPATLPNPQPSTTRAIEPVADVAPDAGSGRLFREGTFVIDRVGHVRRLDDGALLFVFATDGVGAAANDPPMRLVPNLNLMAIESAMQGVEARRFRVTGRVTEYRGRNHLILEKVIVLN